MRGVLNGVLPLGDIRDVEKLCDRVVAQATRGAALTPHQREELVAHLIGEVWILSLRFNPERGARFSTFVIGQLRLRVIDWQRRKMGRGASPGEWGVLAADDLGADELERALARREGDDPADRVASVDGLIAAGSRDGRGLVGTRREPADGRAARGACGAAGD